MKISKKVLSMVLCGFIVFGGSQASLIKADAQSSRNVTTSTQNQGEWRQTFHIKLRAKMNPLLYKSWWSLDLVHTKDGKLRIEGPTNIPENLTFDDRFVLKWADIYGRKYIKGITRFGPSFNLSAADTLRRAINLFNNTGIHDSNYIFIYGKDWNDTVKYSCINPVIKQKSNNNYSQGFHDVSRFWTSFKVTNDGLEEVIFN